MKMRIQQAEYLNRLDRSLADDAEGNSTDQLTEKWQEAMTLWHQGVVCQRFLGDHGKIRHLNSEEELFAQLQKGYQLRKNLDGFAYLFRGLVGGTPGIEDLEQKLDSKVEGNLSVFITYQWGQKELAKQVEAEFKRKGFLVIRDENNLSHGAYIKGFMRIIGHPKLDYVVPVVSRGYLLSRNCMHEVNQVMNRYNWQATTLPIVIQNDPSDSADIYGGVRDYVEHWQKKLKSAKNDEDRGIIDAILKNIRRFGEEVSGKLRIGEQELLSKSFSPLFGLIEAHQAANAGTKFKKIDELLSLADYEATLEDNDEAERLFEEACELTRDFPTTDARRLTAQLFLGRFLIRYGDDPERGRRLVEPTVNVFSALFGEAHHWTIYAQWALAFADSIASDDPTAEARLAARLAELADVARQRQDSGSMLATLLPDLAIAQTAAGNYNATRKSYAEYYFIGVSQWERRKALSPSRTTERTEELLYREALHIAWYSFQCGCFGEATGWMLDALSRAPASDHCLLRAELGVAAWFSGDIVLAEACFRAVLDSCASGPPDGTGPSEVLCAVFGDWVATYPATDTAQLGLARIARHQGRDGEALAWARACTSDNEGVTNELRMAEAAELERRGCHAEALELTEAVVLPLSRTPNVRDLSIVRRYRLLYARRLAEAGHADMAEEVLRSVEEDEERSVLPDDPEREVTRVARARVAAARGDLEEARRLLDGVLARTQAWDARLAPRKALAQEWR